MNFRLFSDRASFESTAGTIGSAFSKFYKPLYYFAFEQLQNKARAEDAVATAFLECWKNISDDPELPFTASRLENDLYEYAQHYCHRHLNQLYRDRVLSDIFNKEIEQDKINLKIIETKVIHQLAG
jgi:retron-type reverse transcriptase